MVYCHVGGLVLVRMSLWSNLFCSAISAVDLRWDWAENDDRKMRRKFEKGKRKWETFVVSCWFGGGLCRKTTAYLRVYTRVHVYFRHFPSKKNKIFVYFVKKKNKLDFFFKLQQFILSIIGKNQHVPFPIIFGSFVQSITFKITKNRILKPMKNKGTDAYWASVILVYVLNTAFSILSKKIYGKMVLFY